MIIINISVSFAVKLSEGEVTHSTASRLLQKNIGYDVRLLSSVSILTRDIDIANLSVRLSVCPSVRYVPVSDENDLTYRRSLFTIR